MTYVNGYVVNHKGQIYEISKLSRKAVGTFIGTHYGKIRSIQRELFLLHQRLHDIRIADGEEATLDQLQLIRPESHRVQTISELVLHIQRISLLGIEGK